ncbi:hypothetical protein EYC80_009074 [Monilinia laxa]|uniref:Uncharacterized protein n=1 Tax=Monilinia laxa TaxID=61186 RepID=A0A5N6K2P0_MONLA|nr:hypothetical protein EYC80_009074 [Monilinia laxa]
MGFAVCSFVFVSWHLRRNNNLGNLMWDIGFVIFFEGLVWVLRYSAFLYMGCFVSNKIFDDLGNEMERNGNKSLYERE